MVRLTSLGLSLALCLAWGSLADAQRAGTGSGSFGGGGSSGLGGGRLTGGGFGTGGVSGSRGMASQGGGMGGMGSFGGGMGQGMGQGMGMGMGGGGQMGFGASGNQGFIGRDAADVQAMFQSMGAGQQGAGARGAQSNRGQGSRGQGNRGQGNRAQNQGGGEQTRSPIRVRVQVAFDYPAPTEVGGPVAFAPTQYDRILEDRRVENFAITRDGTRIVLTGVAADASERLLMERLVMLEPGVRQVDNQMTLAEEIAAPTLQDSEE